MSNREQFEAWWKSEGYDEKLSCVQGIMFNHIKANMFFAWQAATSAIEAKCAALAAELKQIQIDAGCYKKGMQASNERLVQVSAENAALKEWSPNPHSASMFEAIEKAEALMDDGMPELAMVEAFEILKMKRTPATDTSLAEVRAQGVEMFGQYHNFSEKLFIQKEAKKFASQLRKGVQS